MSTPHASGKLLGTVAAIGQQAAVAARRRFWLATVVALLVIGMLLALQQVVAQSMADGVLRRTTLAAQAEASWRCKLLRSAAERNDCLDRAAGRQPLPSPRGRASRVSTPLEK